MNPEEEFQQLCEDVQYCDQVLEARECVDLVMNIISYLLEHEEYKTDIVDKFACDLTMSLMETFVSERAEHNS